MEKCTKSELLCFLCNKKFQKPKILNCLHNYCEACLEKMKQSNRISEEKIRCPCCREITEGGVQKMKTNYFLVRLVRRDVFFEELKSKTISCSVCATAAASSHCFDCGKFLCSNCRMVHDNLPPSSEHKIIFLDECREEKVPTDLPVSGGDVRCQNHGEKCHYFCETCQELVCRDCTVLDHPSQSHTYTNLETAAIEGKKSTKALMSQLEKKLSKFEESLSLFKQLDPIFKKHSKQTIAEVQAFAAKIREELTAQEKNLVQHIRTESQQQTKLFNLTCKSLSESITRARFSLEAGVIFTQKSTESEFLWLRSLVENNLQMLVDEELPSVPKTVEFLGDEEDNVHLGELKKVDTEQYVQEHIQETKISPRSGYLLRRASQRKPKEEDVSLQETPETKRDEYPSKSEMAPPPSTRVLRSSSKANAAQENRQQGNFIRTPSTVFGATQRFGAFSFTAASKSLPTANKVSKDKDLVVGQQRAPSSFPKDENDGLTKTTTFPNNQNETDSDDSDL